MGRSILSVQLAIGFALVAVLALGATGRVELDRSGDATGVERAAPAESADASSAGVPSSPVRGGARAAAAPAATATRPCRADAPPAPASPYVAARVGVPGELLDALPLWRGAVRQDCGGAATAPRARRPRQQRPRAHRARA